MILKPRPFRKPRKSKWTKNLAGLWLMNEGTGGIINDLSGNGSNGTLVNNTAWIAGDSGPTLTFDGANDSVTIPQDNLPAFGTGDFTIIAKVKIPSDGSNRGIVAKGGSAAGDFWFYKRNTNALGFYADAGGIFASGGAWPDDVWTYVAVRRIGTILQLFVNGLYDGQDTTAGDDLNDAGAWTFGLDADGNLDLAGEIEFVYIYRRGLSNAEIAQLHREPFCMFERDPIELWSAATQGGGAPATTILPQITSAYMRI